MKSNRRKPELPILADMDGTVVHECLSVRWEVLVPTKRSGSTAVRSRKFHFWDKDKDWFMTCGHETWWETVGSKSVPCDYISVRVKWVDESPSLPITVSVQVESGSTGAVLSTLSEPKQEVITFESAIWSKRVMDVQRADPLFARNRKLIFRVTLGDKDWDQNSISTTDAYAQTVSYASEYLDNACLESLSADLSKLLDKDSNPDVELHCEGHTTRAHLNVLCSRSPVLAKLLQSVMEDGTTWIVNVQDMTNDTLQQFLRYLYTGKLRDALTFDTALKFYEIGESYAVKSLTKMCSQFLFKNLSDENVCDVLTVADAHSDFILSEAAISFILEKEIPLKSDRWSTVCESHSVLATKVLNQFCKAQSSLLSKLRLQQS